MKTTHLMIALLGVLLMQSQAQSQSQSTEPPKFEVAAEFTTLEREAYPNSITAPGGGVRFTYNLNRMISFEAAGYFFPKQCDVCGTRGNVAEVLGGVKIGKRFEHWGIFGKARPGVVSFSQGKFSVIPDPSNPGFPFQFIPHQLTSFATDLGGVVEFYPSRRIVTRFDAGDTIIHFGRRPVQAIFFDPATSTYRLEPFTLPARTTNNFQFMASVGFRF